MFALERAAELISENNWLICRVLFAGYLCVLAAMDIRWKRMNLLVLLLGAVFSLAGVFCDREIPLTALAAGGCIGALFLLMSRTTREAFGYGDSILITIMGSFLGFWGVLSVLMTAFFIAAVFSIYMLVRKRFHRKSSFAFVPFLTVAYIGGMLFGAY